MSIQIHCPSCQKTLKVPDHLQGKAVKCPSCAATFTAAGTRETVPEPPPLADDQGDYDPESVPSLPPKFNENRGREGDDEEDQEDDDRPRRRKRLRRDVKPHRGQTIMIMGILSIVLAPILGPFAWIMGNNDLKEMRAGRMDREGESQTNTGRICGIIGTILGGLSLFCCCGYFIFVFAIIGAQGAGGGMNNPGGPPFGPPRR